LVNGSLLRGKNCSNTQCYEQSAHNQRQKLCYGSCSNLSLAGSNNTNNQQLIIFDGISQQPSTLHHRHSMILPSEAATVQAIKLIPPRLF
jgi:hypothetical protein